MPRISRGFFAIFAGFMYNDFFSIGLQIFESRWKAQTGGSVFSAMAKDPPTLWGGVGEMGTLCHAFGRTCSPCCVSHRQLCNVPVHVHRWPNQQLCLQDSGDGVNFIPDYDATGPHSCVLRRRFAPQDPRPRILKCPCATRKKRTGWLFKDPSDQEKLKELEAVPRGKGYGTEVKNSGGRGPYPFGLDWMWHGLLG